MQVFSSFDKVPVEFLPPPRSGAAVRSPLTHLFAYALCQQDELTNAALNETLAQENIYAVKRNSEQDFRAELRKQKHKGAV
ncbi:uncharacterized [Tachysurus ichikawai]